MNKRIIKIILTLEIDGCQDVSVDVQTDSLSARTYKVAHEGVVDEFLEEKTRRSDGKKVHSSKLFDKYEQWTQDKNYKVLDRRAFGLQLKSRGYKNERDGKGRYRWIDLEIV